MIQNRRRGIFQCLPNAFSLILSASAFSTNWPFRSASRNSSKDRTSSRTALGEESDSADPVSDRAAARILLLADACSRTQAKAASRSILPSSRTGKPSVISWVTRARLILSRRDRPDLVTAIICILHQLAENVKGFSRVLAGEIPR